MKYYKDDILSKWSAKFKDKTLEQSFLSECSSKRFKITYLICTQIMVFSCMQIIFFSQTNIITYSQICAPLLLVILVKFVPMKYSQYFIMLGQVYSTFSICSRNAKEQHKPYEIYYMNGITQAVIWIIEVQNFTAETIAMIANIGIITYFQQVSYIYSVNYSFSIIIVCAYKYFHNVNDRKLYLALKNFQEWENIFEKIIPNLFILQSFDYRTHKMSVDDCNKRAQQFDIQKSQEKYIQFLGQLQIEEFNSYCKQHNHENKCLQFKTLKDYLLQRHANVYSHFIHNKLNKQRKFKSMKTSSSKQNNQDQNQDQLLSEEKKIETLKVSLIKQDQQQKTYFKVNVYTVVMNQPYLVICLEDISFLQKMKKLEDNLFYKNDLALETVNCIKNKLSSVEYSAKNPFQSQQIIVQVQIILQAFIQKLRNIKIESFQFNEIINQIKQIYQSSEFKVEGNLPNLKINSDKGFILTTLMSFISILGAENIEFFKISLIKDQFCEKILLIIQSSQINLNVDDQSQISLFDLQSSSKINFMCWEYIQNIMKLICLKDKPQIQLIGIQQVQIQIEYIVDVNTLLLKKSLDLDKDKQLLQKTMTNISNHTNQYQLANSIYQNHKYKNMSTLNEYTKHQDATYYEKKLEYSISDFSSLN
ncbi:hypothetical protein ABPG74_000829 [Tetrahymena malaccensis]